MATVTIDDETIDDNDPCAVAAALRRVELQVVTGGAVIRSRFGDDEVNWSAANINRLREKIADYERRCAAKNGCRTRFAKRARFIR